MAQHNTREGRFNAAFGGVALAGVVAAFFVAPILKFANPVALMVCGIVCGVALLGIYNSRVVSGVKAWAGDVAQVVLAIGAFGIVLTLVFAAQTSNAIDAYCWNVESRIVSADHAGKPVGDLKDVFETLQCRAQGIYTLVPPAPPVETIPLPNPGDR